MRRRALLWALCLLVGAGARAGSWSNLWLTPAQQGQRLLDAGHPAQAAHRFRDPRRRAYADLEARRYAAAAKLLAPFKDPESEYNRGNALARSGRLHAALDAYDAALKKAPTERDIRHNRDLVARALRKRQKKRPERNASAGRQGRKRPQAKSGRGTHRQQNGGGGTRGHGKAARPPSKQVRRKKGHGSQANDAAKTQTRRPAGQRANARSGHPGAGRHAAIAAAAPPGRSPQQGAEAERQHAKRDAAAALRLQRRRAKAGAHDRSGPSPATASRGHGSKPPPPPTESALSLDQWLRRIPDNPAGLLRRKFLIENALRARQDLQQ